MDEFIYIDMYNETVKHIKYTYNKKEKLGNLAKVKKDLTGKKQIIYDNSKISLNNRDIYISKHILDYALNDSINAYHSCLTNLKRKNIRYFRLRPLKKSKKKQNH